MVPVDFFLKYCSCLMTAGAVFVILSTLAFLMAKHLEGTTGFSRQTIHRFARNGLITGVLLLLIPLPALFSGFPSVTQPMQTPGGEVQIQQMQIKRLNQAIEQDDAEEMDQLLNEQSLLMYYTDSDKTLLGLAIQANAEQVVRCLLSRGVDPAEGYVEREYNLVEMENNSVDLACAYLFSRDRDNMYAILDMLLDRGVSVNSGVNYSSLHRLAEYIAKKGYADSEDQRMVQRFLDAGADLLARDRREDVPFQTFDEAIRISNYDEETVEQLSVIRRMLVPTEGKRAEP